MWRVTLKGLLAHKLRLALTALAIVLGVTFIAGTFVLTDTLHNTFDTLFGNIYQNIDFQVRGVAQFGSGGTATRNPVPESVLARVQAVPGVEAADGSVTGYAQYIAPDGKAISTGGAPTLGVSFDPDQRISAAPPGPGRAARRRRTRWSWTSARRRSTASGCGQRGAHPAARGRPGRSPSSAWPASGRPTTWPGRRWPPSTPPTAQALLGEVGQFDAINVVTQPGADKAAVQRAIARVLPARRRGGHRPDRGRRGHERHRPGAGLPQHGPARLRLHRAVRGRLHHPEHLLHHRGSAHPGAGAAAHRRAPAAARCSAPSSARRRSWGWCRR